MNHQFKYLLVILSNMAIALQAQTLVKGKVVDAQNEVIAGANIWWYNSTVGTMTSSQGEFEIESIPSTNLLLVSYIGYQTDTIEVSDPSKFQNILLQGELELKEVVINQQRFSTVTSRIDPLQTQKITRDEICRAACCNLGESFETNASVDVSYSDAATGAKQIRLLGLAGTYVQMMTEQIPNLQGAASPYGLSYIPGSWMESIQISKGTSSVKNGYEALTGQINVEYKKPQTADPISIDLFASHMGRVDANIDAFVSLNERLKTGILFNYAREKENHDDNGDGFLDSPQIEQFNAINRWYYKNDHLMSQTLLNYIHEERKSGQVTHHKNLENPYQIGIQTNRAVIYTKNGYILDKAHNSSVALLLSGIYHDQDSYFGNTLYNVTQKNVYANLVYETELTEAHRISTGLSYLFDRYNQNMQSVKVQNLDHSLLDHTQKVGGAYFQYSFIPSEKLTLMLGVRGDKHNQEGCFVTPRFHLKAAPFGDWLNIRASVGRGYRYANVLVENSYLLASNRTVSIQSNLDPFEAAWNYGASAHFAFNLFNRPLSFMIEWYYTTLQKQVVVDLENPTQANIYNLKGKSYAQNTQMELTYPFFKGFTVTGAFRWTDAKTNYQGVLLEKPLTNRYKGLLSGSYQTRLKKWQIDVTSQFNGKGRMPNPGTEMLWDTYFPSYVSLNAQITKNFKTWSIYVGGENLTGYTQKVPIVDAQNPWGEDSHFDASMVWGPVHGAKYYIGLRWSLSKN